jgi:hypothetical protein
MPSLTFFKESVDWFHKPLVHPDLHYATISAFGICTVAFFLYSLETVWMNHVRFVMGGVTILFAVKIAFQTLLISPVFKRLDRC